MGINVYVTSDDANLSEKTPLPRVDWVLLPLLSLLTIAIITVSLRLFSAVVFKASAPSLRSCLIMNDPSTGVRAVPDSVCWKKAPESEWAEYRFNSCGHRAGMECGHKAPGQYRIVMMGSSYGFGLWVPRERSFAATLPTELSRLTGKRIELYNVSMQWGFPANFVLRFHEILAANPDIILWDLTPADVEYATLVLPLQDPPRPSYISRVRSRFADNSLPDAVAMLLNSGWSAAVRSLLGPGIIPIEHVLYSSRTQYVESALTKPDSEVGFLKAQPSPAWREHLQEFDREAATIEAQANEAGIPFVAVLIPDRAQAAMISTREWPIGYDPYKLDDELRSIVVSHAGIYVDILPDFRETANPEQHYFPVDGHPDAAGQAMISAMLAAALSRGAVPALSVAAKQQIAQEQGN